MVSMGFTASDICTGTILRQFTAISSPNFVCCLMKEIRAENFSVHSIFLGKLTLDSNIVAYIHM